MAQRVERHPVVEEAILNDEWIHLGEIPVTARILNDDGTESVEPLRSPREGEIVVKVLRSWIGLTGSGAVGEVVVAHERDELVVGDRLLLSDRAPCGHCETCRRGHPTMCPDAARALIPSFRRDLVLVPSWIARRGRVRLPFALSDEAATALGENAWILRGLRRVETSNPLRILVAGDDRPAVFLGALLETCWPDARRVLWGGGARAGYHAVVSSNEQALEALSQPADLILVLRATAGAQLGGVAASGARMVLFGDAELLEPGSLWRREITVFGSTGGVSSDIEAWRKHFEAFSQRWNGLSG